MGYHYDMPGTEPTPTPQPCIHDGDVNDDDAISPADALGSFQIYLGINPDPTYQQTCSADCNGSGSVTPEDALCIFQNYINGSCACQDML